MEKSTRGWRATPSFQFKPTLLAIGLDEESTYVNRLFWTIGIDEECTYVKGLLWASVKELQNYEHHKKENDY